MTKGQKFLLAGIVVIAVFFRFYRILKIDCGSFYSSPVSCHAVADMPGGLFPDEAANGLDINLMQQGHIQPFYERGNGREALFFYMEWASATVFGHGVWQFHVVSALIGVFAVLMTFFVARELFGMDVGDGTVREVGAAIVGPIDGQPMAGPTQNDDNYHRKKNRAINIALLAAFLMAVSTWHTVLSRTAFRANLTPLFGALALYCLLRTYRATTVKSRVWLAILTGAVFALGFYTYIAFRVMAPILFMVLVWPLFAARRRDELKETLKKWWKPFAFFTLAFVIFVLPLANYFYHNFDYFIGRSGQVSIFNQTLYTVNGQQLTTKLPLSDAPSVFVEVTKTALVGFFTKGDLNWRQNISGFPFLTPLVSPFFGAGLVLISLLGVWYFFAPNKRAKYWKYFLLTGWFWGMLLPELATAEGIPHGLRSAGAIAPTFIIAAWALYEFVKLVMEGHNHMYKNWAGLDSWQYKLSTGGFKLVAGVFFAALISQTYILYFVVAYNDPSNFYWFRSDLTPVSQYLNDYGNKQNTYLILDKFSVQATDYLTTVDGAHPQNPKNMPYIQVDPENSWQLKLKPGDQIVFTQSSIFDITKFKQYHPEAKLFEEYRNKFGQADMAVYKVY